jgi:hypothetical protein
MSRPVGNILEVSIMAPMTMRLPLFSTIRAFESPTRPPKVGLRRLYGMLGVCTGACLIVVACYWGYPHVYE